MKYNLNALEALHKRRSVRKYIPNALIPKEVIKKLVDVARCAPSASNIQPWEFVVVTDKGIRKKLAEVTDYGKFIAEAPHCIAVFCKDTKYYLEDGSAAIENILIAATALGLGSCWVAGDKKSYAKTVCKLLDAPDGYKLVAMIPIGYSNEKESQRIKRGIEEILHYERF